MNYTRRTWLALSACLTLAFLPSCNKDSSGSGGPVGAGAGAGSGGKIKVAIVTNNPADFWNICEKGANDAAKKLDVELVFRKPEKGDAAIQRDIVSDLVKRGVNGIAVSVINPEEQTPDLKLISEQTNLITMDNDAKDCGRLCYVGTDNYEAGKAVGRLVKEAMPQGGKIAIFVGQITPINARQRFQGVVDELAGQENAKGPNYGKYNLYRNEAITDGANKTTATQNASDALEILKAEQNLCMVGLWAYNAPAILEAARSKGLVNKIKIVSFDEERDTLAAIGNGEIFATVVQDPYNFGYKSVEILTEIARSGDKKKAESIKGAVPHRVVTKDGGTGRVPVKEFTEQLDKLLAK